MINAGERNFKNFYLEDRNYFNFDTVSGVSADLFFNQYEIVTDHSLYPWEEKVTEKGREAKDMAIWRNYQIQPSTNEYFKMFIRRSTKNYSFTRSFQKIDETFAYIGGLFGTIIFLLIFLNLYSKYVYEM